MSRIIKENFIYILIIIGVILIRMYIVTPVRVSGSSMDDTLTNGDIMLLYKMAQIKRNDIVVIDKSVEGDAIIKRVIALPGETIKCENGIIYINDKKYNDKHAFTDTNDFEEVKLKNDEYYVLGDNRRVSKDSRYFGPINKDKIKGSSSIRLYPFNQIGKVK